MAEQDYSIENIKWEEKKKEEADNNVITPNWFLRKMGLFIIVWQWI